MTGGRTAMAASRPQTAAGRALRPPARRGDGAPASRLRAMLLSLEYTPKLSGGMGTQVFELSRGLARRGDEVTVMAYAPGEPGVVRLTNETVHLISHDSFRGAALGRLSIVEGILEFNRALVDAARRLIAGSERPPDVLHYHNWATYPAASELSDLFGIPTLGTIHFVSEPIERWWGQTPDPEIVEQERRMFGEAERLVAVSRSLREVVRSAHGLEGRPFGVVHNGLDPAPFMSLESRAGERRRLRRTVADDDDRIVLFAGRLNPQKGVEALLAAAARVLDRQPEVRYLVAGEPDSRDFGRRLDELRRRSAIPEGRLQMLGKLPRRQLATLYQVADLAVVPSLYEPFGYAAIEAMAAAVPVVATRAGGLAEIVEEGVTGLLVPVEGGGGAAREVDVERLADCQLRLLRDAEGARGMGLAGRERVLSRFTAERMVESTAAAYRTAPDDDATRRAPGEPAGSVSSGFLQEGDQ